LLRQLEIVTQVEHADEEADGKHNKGHILETGGIGSAPKTMGGVQGPSLEWMGSGGCKLQ